MSGGQQFYGFAAVVIPVLLFGGAVVERWIPHGLTPRPAFAWGVVLAMLFAIVAEVMTIGAAFTGRASAPEGAIVVLAVVGGTIAAAGAVTWPWRAALGSVYGRIVVGTLIAGGVLVVTTYQAISGAGPRSELARIEQTTLRLAEDQHSLTLRLNELASLDSETQRTLRNEARLLAGNLGRARAGAVLFELLRIRQVDRDDAESGNW